MTSFVDTDGSKIAMSEFWKPAPIHPPVREWSELSYLGRTVRWLREEHPSIMDVVVRILKTTFIPNELKLLGWGVAIGLGFKHDIRILLIYSGVMLTSYLFNMLADNILDEYRAQIREEEDEQALLDPEPGSREEHYLKLQEEIKENIQRIQTILNLNPRFKEVPTITPKREIYRDWREAAVADFSECFLDNQPASSPIFVGRNDKNDPYLFLRIKPKNPKDNPFWITLFPYFLDDQKVHWKIIVEEPGQKFKDELSLVESIEGILFHTGPSLTLIEELVSRTHKDFEIDFDIPAEPECEPEESPIIDTPPAMDENHPPEKPTKEKKSKPVLKLAFDKHVLSLAPADQMKFFKQSLEDSVQKASSNFDQAKKKYEALVGRILARDASLTEEDIFGFDSFHVGSYGLSVDGAYKACRQIERTYPSIDFSKEMSEIKKLRKKFKNQCACYQEAVSWAWRNFNQIEEAKQT